MYEIIKWISIADRFGKIYLNRYFRELGTNSSQHMFIKKICEAEGITQDKLYPVLHINKSNVTRALAQLEAEGLIRKEPSRKDKRTARLYPTEKAKCIYERIVEIETEWIDIMTENFSVAEKEQLLALLDKAAQNAMNAVYDEEDV